MRRAGLLLFALPLVGCGSYRKDVETICFAPERVAREADADPSRRATLIAEYLSQNLQTSEGRKLMGAMAAVEPAMQPELLQHEARRAGLSSCPLAEEESAHATFQPTATPNANPGPGQLRILPTPQR